MERHEKRRGKRFHQLMIGGTIKISDDLPAAPCELLNISYSGALIRISKVVYQALRDANPKIIEVIMPKLTIKGDFFIREGVDAMYIAQHFDNQTQSSTQLQQYLKDIDFEEELMGYFKSTYSRHSRKMGSVLDIRHIRQNDRVTSDIN